MELLTLVAPKRVFEREYSKALILGAFRRSLVSICVGPSDEICALGDGEVRVYTPDGSLQAAWTAPADATCLTVDHDGRVYLGAPARVEVRDAKGVRVGAIAVGDLGRPAHVTAVRVFRGDVLVADASARLIRRLSADGKPLAEIGSQAKTGGFMLPNRSLDFAVDKNGIVRAGDTGRHRVTAWSLDGAPLGHFGKFGHQDPADFVGCCNPVNLALAPDGKLVTAEKMIARVKVYEPDGKLLALIGPPSFDAMCTAIPLAVDANGRIIAADTVSREIKVFAKVRG
jgi:sugar lactone lactonase YvrE